MTINLPIDLETSIAIVVQSGRFSSMDEAMAEAARLLLKQIEPVKPPIDPANDPILGLFHDDAELMDAIVAQAYRDRGTDDWRDIDV